MNTSNPEPPKSRLELVKELAAQGRTIGADLPKSGRLVVSIDKLVEDPKNERKTFHNMEELVASVRSVGILEPLTVVPVDGEKYQIVTGHRRFRAALAAGLDKVEILIRGDEAAHQRRIKSLISNIQRENVPPLELAGAIKELIEHEGLSQDQVAERLGKTKHWVSAVLRILDLPAAAKEKVGSSQLAVSVDALTRIARLDDATLQVELVDALLSGMSGEQVREHIEKSKKKGGAVKTPKPKRVYHTDHKADVIVQAKTTKLTQEQVIEALKEALAQAKNG